MSFDADTIAWSPQCFDRSPLKHLAAEFALAEQKAMPGPDWLNAQRPTKMTHTFMPQDKVTFNDRYYEQVIGEDKVIPTRANWHDLFNGLIWCQFPNAKAELNRQHIADIHQHGVSPRTARRNRITHFDECGVVLAYSEPAITELLAEHQWLDGFYSGRPQWGRTVQAFIFGHANYEMLLAPYIGLTGKWLGLKVEEHFFEQSRAAQYAQLDTKLAFRLRQEDCLATRGALHPLPLLGVPGWYENQSPAFYQNQNYFMPKRRR
ncbi:hypothetical protein HMF8227_01046 [Saliniradius amylolyticus]|uniref:DUF3025 domain-containing protein n=1 Tax=Saliniradius amylolyticus TaxID=2183582 RepID=A0A2S2E1M3_9ALTE|nr:DUF3025 domain-containing protein [Saliniradius amylolyticus]AWL11534.1 hypothetical protein HMF8227_01046 [Saliniradius amylolyticus]